MIARAIAKPSRPSAEDNLILESGPAAVLVRALSVHFHGSSRFVRELVGAGWRLTHDPTHKCGLSGGTFDDAGFPTVTSVLADGRKIVNYIGSDGYFSRVSFRDELRPSFGCLAIEPGSHHPNPPPGRWVSHLRLVPLGPDTWSMELRGPAGSTWWVAGLNPKLLVAAVSGTWGRPITSSEGVLTPGLILDARELGTK